MGLVRLVCQRYGTAQYSERREYLAHRRQELLSLCSKRPARTQHEPQGNAYCPARINVRRKAHGSPPAPNLLVVNYVSRHSHRTLDTSQEPLDVSQLPLNSQGAMQSSSQRESYAFEEVIAGTNTTMIRKIGIST